MLKMLDIMIKIGALQESAKEKRADFKVVDNLWKLIY